MIHGVRKSDICPDLASWLRAAKTLLGHDHDRPERRPGQWDLVRADPGLIPNAVNEVVRIESPIRSFGRITSKDTEIGGVAIPAGSRVVVSYASANRDERRFATPEAFDVTRADAVHQLGFGMGEHGCAGQGLARRGAESLLAALATRVTRFHLGATERGLNNLIRAFAKVQVALDTADIVREG